MVFPACLAVVVVAASDLYNELELMSFVAQITGYLDEKDDPACLFLDTSPPDSLTTGLTRDCLVSCYLLSLMSEDSLRERIGRLPDRLLVELDGCLKASLGLP
jgi:mRNA-degrading endonuclease toxin of MazEF toxin-antitoxin module